MTQLKMNQLCMSSKIPRIALTSKQAVLQSNTITRATEKSIPIREELATSVENRFYPELVARSKGGVGWGSDGCHASQDSYDKATMRSLGSQATYDYRGSQPLSPMAAQ